MRIEGFRPALSRPLTKPAPPTADGEALYDYFLKQQDGHNSDHLAFLDRGIEQSPLKDQIAQFPRRLQTIRPDASSLPARPYPELGQIPAIDGQGLDFLHPSISHACLAIGSWQDGQLQTRWLGRQAVEPAQMWSATKAFPMVRTVTRLGAADPARCHLQAADGSGKIGLPAAFDAIVSYRQGGSASNQLARTLKQLDTPVGLEGWLHGLTGNTQSTFRGGYGEPPSIARPLLQQGNQTLLKASGQDHKGSNLVSAYDLCRNLANLGWHAHLEPQKRLPGLQSKGAEALTNALAVDSARMVDVSWEALGLQDRIENPVVLSKMGFGLSDERNQWEEVYSTFVQFTDKASGQQHQFCLALKGYHSPQGDRPAEKLDSRVAAQVAIVVRKLVDGQI